MLIAYEGIDGSGKNTQVRMLLAFLRQSKVQFRLHKYPTARARAAFRHLSGKETHTAGDLAEIFAQDILKDREKIAREISQGFVVICDRYLQSTLAYQAVGAGYPELKGRLSELGARSADVVFLLDLDPKVSAKRKRKQKKPDRFEKDLPFLSKVRKNYLRMARECFLSYRYVVVSAKGSPDEVFTGIITQVEPLITKRMGKN